MASDSLGFAACMRREAEEVRRDSDAPLLTSTASKCVGTQAVMAGEGKGHRV